MLSEEELQEKWESLTLLCWESTPRHEEELQEKWESLTFTDNFIFSHVMHDENICRQVVELILGVRIGKIFSWGS